MKAGVPESVRGAGGRIFAVTSEPQTLAREAVGSWGLDFGAVGDPHHEVADSCRERGWLDVIVNPHVEFLRRMHSWASHPRGYFQPGVLAVSRDGRVLYRWRGVPTRRNAGGATDRPEAPHVWSSIERALTSPASGDAALDVPPSVEMHAPSWPLFVTLLLANGNIIRPRGFGLERGAPFNAGRRERSALVKIVLFVASWIAAFTLLPGYWVLAALAAWGLAVTPGIVVMHREFQSVRED